MKNRTRRSFLAKSGAAAAAVTAVSCSAPQNQVQSTSTTGSAAVTNNPQTGNVMRLSLAEESGQLCSKREPFQIKLIGPHQQAFALVYPKPTPPTGQSITCMLHRGGSPLPKGILDKIFSLRPVGDNAPGNVFTLSEGEHALFVYGDNTGIKQHPNPADRFSDPLDTAHALIVGLKITAPAVCAGTTGDDNDIWVEC